MSEITGEKMQDIYDAAVRVEFNEKQGKSEDATFDFLCVMGADLAEVSATVRKLIDMVRARDVELLAVREAQSVPAGKFVLEPSEHRYHHIKHGEYQHTEPKLPMVKLYTAPPAVPGELLDAMAEVIRISDRDHEAWDRAKAAISVCRAAMLQPVSQGYTFEGLNIRAVAALRESVRNQWLKSEEFADKIYWKNMHSIANEIIEAMAAAPTPTK